MSTKGHYLISAHPLMLTQAIKCKLCTLSLKLECGMCWARDGASLWRRVMDINKCASALSLSGDALLLMHILWHSAYNPN